MITDLDALAADRTEGRRLALEAGLIVEAPAIVAARETADDLEGLLHLHLRAAHAFAIQLAEARQDTTPYRGHRNRRGR